MKIALLNLPLDNNYGGNLQRYALMKVLQDMGHDVTHICLMIDDRIPWYSYPYLFAKGLLKKYVLHKDRRIVDDIIRLTSYKQKLINVTPFYEKYIKHTEKCLTVKEIVKVTNNSFETFIVGSDQIWRKDMSHSIGWKNFLFSFLSDEKVKRVAYGVSFGNDKLMYNKAERRIFADLYSCFFAVSVREDEGINLLQEMGCVQPKAIQVLDPTMLLEKDDYIKLFDNEPDKLGVKGKIFCYVLDKSDYIDNIIKKKSEKLGKDAVAIGISGADYVSIPLWLKCIYDADYIITDSYHGVVFSILFEKQFYFCGNKIRGNSRIESLFRMLDIKNPEAIRYKTINTILAKQRALSKDFLRNALNA